MKKKFLQISFSGTIISSLTHVKKEKCHNPLKILGCGTSHHGIDIW